MVEQPIFDESEDTHLANVDSEQLGDNTKTGNDMIESSSDAGSTFGKFKDATSLMNAYINLQAEFTRKSQRLAELEKNTKLIQESSGDDLNNPALTLEKSNNLEENETTGNSAEGKTDTNAISNETSTGFCFDNPTWKNEVSDFFDTNPSAKKFAREIGAVILNNPELAKSKNALELGFLIVQGKNSHKPADLINDEQFLTDYVFSNPEIENHFVNAYLQNLNVKKTPNLISTGGATPSSSNKKFASFEEAGKMLLKSLYSKLKENM